MSDLNNEKIAKLNDMLRQTFLTGKVIITHSIQELTPELREQVLTKVRTYDGFCFDNNPHDERDFGAFEIGDQSYFWKIDYYDSDLNYHSPNSADLEVTRRVLTIMLAEEY